MGVELKLMNVENSVKQAILGLLIDFLLLFLFSVLMKVYFEREIYQCENSNQIKSELTKHFWFDLPTSSTCIAPLVPFY